MAAKVSEAGVVATATERFAVEAKIVAAATGFAAAAVEGVPAAILAGTQSTKIYISVQLRGP